MASDALLLSYYSFLLDINYMYISFTCFQHYAHKKIVPCTIPASQQQELVKKHQACTFSYLQSSCASFDVAAPPFLVTSSMLYPADHTQDTTQSVRSSIFRHAYPCMCVCTWTLPIVLSRFPMPWRDYLFRGCPCRRIALLGWLATSPVGT